MQNKLFLLVHKCTPKNRVKDQDKHKLMALVISRERTEIFVAKEGEL